MIHCPNCNHLIESNDTFCPYCGASLEGISSHRSIFGDKPNINKSNGNLNFQPTNSSNSFNRHFHKKHHYIRNAFIAFILLIVGVGGGYIFAHNNDKGIIQHSNNIAYNESHKKVNVKYKTRYVTKLYQRINCPEWLRGYWFSGYNHKKQYSIFSFNKHNNPWNNDHARPIFFRVNKNKVLGGFSKHDKAFVITINRRNNHTVLQGVHYAEISPNVSKLPSSKVKRSHHHSRLFRKVSYHQFTQLVHNGTNDK